MPVGAVWDCSGNNSYYDEGDDDREEEEKKREQHGGLHFLNAVCISEPLSESWQNSTASP